MENTAGNFRHPLEQLSLEVKIVGEEEEVKRDDGSEEENDEKGRGEEAGAPESRLCRVHCSDPGVKLSFLDSHSQTRFGHKQPTYKVLRPVTHLHNWTVTSPRTRPEYKINCKYRIPELRMEMKSPLHYLPQQALFSFILRLQ